MVVRLPSFLQDQPLCVLLASQNSMQDDHSLLFWKHCMPPGLRVELQHLVLEQSSPGTEQGSSAQVAPSQAQCVCGQPCLFLK
mmetsp:Transcript_142390/g.455072  ORF Transcript_142390/g.455072 Transcript_142390/m.455072 type:complete len:83 (+) Transcript_142390:1005-1253(+)